MKKPKDDPNAKDVFDTRLAFIIALTVGVGVTGLSIYFTNENMDNYNKMSDTIHAVIMTISATALIYGVKELSAPGDDTITYAAIGGVAVGLLDFFVYKNVMRKVNRCLNPTTRIDIEAEIIRIKNSTEKPMQEMQNKLEQLQRESIEYRRNIDNVQNTASEAIKKVSGR